MLAIYTAGVRAADYGYFLHFMATAAAGYAGTTLVLTLGVTLGSLLLGGYTAWLTSHYEFRGRAFLQWALILPLAFPSDVLALVYRELTGYYGPLWQFVKAVSGASIPLRYWFVEMESWGGLLFVLSLSFYPFVYIILHTAWRAQPRAYGEIGKSVGLTPFQVFRRITFPLSTPAILVAALVAGFLALNDYVTSILFGKRGIAVAVHNLWHAFDQPVAAAQVVAFLITLIFCLLLGAGWYVVRRRYYDPITPKGARPRVPVRGITGSVTFVASSIPMVLGFLLPLGILFAWALPRVGRLNLSHLLLYTQNSLWVSILTTLACTLLALFYVLRDMHRTPSDGHRLLLLLLNAGYFIPAIALSVGILLILSRARDSLLSHLLSGSVAALVYAMCVRYFCLAFLSISIGRKKMPPRIDDLLRYVHRGFLFSATKVYLPLLKDWVLVGGLITFVSALKEINLSLALAPVNYVSLSTRIYFFTTHEAVRASAVWCLAIVLAALMPVVFVSRRLANMER